jgi:hypothetical protein
MDGRSVESAAVLGRGWLSPTRELLRALSVGFVFTRVLPAFLVVAGALAALAGGAWWVREVRELYREQERWTLVLGVAYLLWMLLVGYAALRFVALRAMHLRRVPAGDRAALRCASLLLRLAGELLFLFACSGAVAALLFAIPSTPWSNEWVAALLGMLDARVAVQLRLAGAAGGLVAGSGFLLLFHVAAGLLDVLVGIEANTTAAWKGRPAVIS